MLFDEIGDGGTHGAKQLVFDDAQREAPLDAIGEGGARAGQGLMDGIDGGAEAGGDAFAADFLVVASAPHFGKCPPASANPGSTLR
jgi:hypothetical protein